MSNVSASVSQRITVQTCFNTDLPIQPTQGVQASFAQQCELVTAAIQNNDAAARDQLLQNLQTPEQVKTLLSGTGFQAHAVFLGDRVDNIYRHNRNRHSSAT